MRTRLHHHQIWLPALLLLSSCAFDHMKENGQKKGGGAVMAGPVSFAEAFGAVISPRCVSCHSVAGGNQGAVNLETFEAVSSIAARVERSVFVDKTMPKGSSLTEQESQLLAAWFAQGATRNGSSGNNAKLRENITWAVVRDEIFAKKCLECHSQPRPEKGLDLSSITEARAKIREIVDRTLITSDESLRMPLPPMERLTPEEKQALATWMARGMPE